MTDPVRDIIGDYRAFAMTGGRAWAATTSPSQARPR
jgi:hypothetical protein